MLEESQLSTTVIGAGAIGHVVAARLGYMGLSTTLITRRSKDQPAAVEAFNTRTLQPSTTFDRTKHTSSHIYWLTAQSYALETILNSLLKYLPDSTVVVVLANGAYIHILKRYQAQFPKLILRPGIVVFHASPSSDDSFKAVTSAPCILWGETTRDTLKLVNSTPKCSSYEEKLLSIQSQIPDKLEFFRYTSSLDHVYMKKWLMNTTLNSLCGAYGMASYTPLLSEENQENLMKPLFSEAYALAQELWGEWQETEEGIYQFMIKTITEFQGGENSLHRHLRTQKPTEIDLLAGMVQKSTTPHHFPLLQNIYKTVKGKEPSAR